jgi:methylenetetrahydrofolate reductase (NADPH)
MSFEVFPSKSSDGFDQVLKAALSISSLSPSYMSVTYGATGSNAVQTAELCEQLLKGGVTPLAHLTCIAADEETITDRLNDFKSKGIRNILALRGDVPEGMERPTPRYEHASDLIERIREDGSFCIGGACYPEHHPESENSDTDLGYLKLKVEAGCEFLVTQMFFDNDILYNFMFKTYRAGINVPVVPGIMPVTNAKQIKRICSISQNTLPQRFLRIVDRFENDPLSMKQAGIAFATEQIIDLYANGFNAVHVYSMNKPDVAAAIKANVSDILK